MAPSKYILPPYIVENTILLLSSSNINIPGALFAKVPGIFILRQISKTNGIEIQRKPGMMPGFRFSKKYALRRRKHRGC